MDFCACKEKNRRNGGAVLKEALIYSDIARAVSCSSGLCQKTQKQRRYFCVFLPCRAKEATRDRNHLIESNESAVP